MKDRKDKLKDIFLAFSFVSFVSSSIIGCMALGYFAGSYLETVFEIYPAGRIAGLVLGMFLAIWTVASQIKTKFIDNDRDKEQ